MPETPDFDQIAILMTADRVHGPAEKLVRDRAFIAEQLRQVWNARGAADRDALLTHGGRLPAKAVALALTALTDLDVK